ncbi:MAG TPA: hypothetical protein VIZ30_07610 [Pseudomonadales bacterium]
MRPRRQVNVFSMSFLDVMSCGFGAIVLLYIMMIHVTDPAAKQVKQEQLSELRKLDFEVTTGQENLAQLSASIDATQRRLAEAARRRLAILSEMTARRDAMVTQEAQTLAQREDLAKLRADVESREQDVKKLEAKAKTTEGTKARSFVGEGDRQYLTGLKIGGERILVAFDTSASMLDDTIVNVIRRRNMSDAAKMDAPKWRRVVRTVEWLTAQLPLDSQYQIYGFNETPRAMVDGTQGKWIDVANSKDLERAIEAVRAVVPTGGTSLMNLAAAAAELSPAPDNIYLVTDGLPTLGKTAGRGTTISGKQRVDLFHDATKHFPQNAPINVIMFPLEGDPIASAAYWDLAQTTGGAYLVPSKDWP